MGRQLGHDHAGDVLRTPTHSTRCRWAGTHPKSRIYNSFYAATAWNARFTGGTDTLPGSGWTRKDNACDASYPPVNGDVGTCTDTLVSGTSCVPTCDAGYVLKGVTSCTDRVLTEVATCEWPFTDGAELKATVDACLDAVPSGDRCCSSDRLCWHPDPAMRRCGAVGCVDMPDWDVSQVDGRATICSGQIELLPGHHGWTFADNADTTGMFTGADTWLSRASRDDTVNTTDGPPGAWVFNPCLENERVENGLCAPCTGGGTNAAGDDPAAGDTGCAFPDSAALKTAVDNCIAVDPTGVACCSHGADCGAAGTAEMAGLGRVAGDEHERAVLRQRVLQRGHIAMGHLERHDHVPDVSRCRRSTKISVHGTPRASRPCTRCSATPRVQPAPIEMGRQLGHEHAGMF